MPQVETMLVPQRIPLIIGPENRGKSDNTDSRLVNCYIEADFRGVQIYKRPGILTKKVVAPGKDGSGMFNWNGSVYSIFYDTLYKDGISVASPVDITGGVYQFSSIVGANPKMVFNNGTFGYAYDDVHGLSVDLHTLNASYPERTVKGWAYLNGAQYVLQHIFGANVTPAVIWGSDINDVTSPGAWDPLNFITAQIEPDFGVCMAKQLVYVISLNTWSTEVFFDAGNPTGSPLQSIPGSKSSYGCASQDSVQNVEDRLVWLSTNRTASLQVVLMERLQVRVVSTKAIDRLLKNADLRFVYSWHFKLNGHAFYVLTIKRINLTLVYDITEDHWEQWTDANGNYFPIVASAYDNTGNVVLQHENNGTTYFLDSRYLTDNVTPINVTIVTPEFDAGTHRRKQMNLFEIIGDQQPGGWMTVECSDDNYATWSQPRRIDMSQARMFLIQCGSFAKRAYRIKFTQNLNFRISAIECQYDLGTL